MKKSKKNYFLVAILFLFVVGAGNVFAAANNDSDNENSVYSWGPWKKMASPAAGAESLDKNDIPVADISEEKKHLNENLKDSYSKNE